MVFIVLVSKRSLAVDDDGLFCKLDRKKCMPLSPVMEEEDVCRKSQAAACEGGVALELQRELLARILHSTKQSTIIRRGTVLEHCARLTRTVPV